MNRTARRWRERAIGGIDAFWQGIDGLFLIKAAYAEQHEATARNRALHEQENPS